jgi:hypothetical protein
MRPKLMIATVFTRSNFPATTNCGTKPSGGAGHPIVPERCFFGTKPRISFKSRLAESLLVPRRSGPPIQGAEPKGGTFITRDEENERQQGQIENRNYRPSDGRRDGRQEAEAECPAIEAQDRRPRHY